MNPKYPIFIPSKGRADTQLYTLRELSRMGVPYSLVVEPHEAEKYEEACAKNGYTPSEILVLPFQDLQQGSIPARNWIWEKAIERGADRHWVIDDNIEGFHRFNRNMKPKVRSGTIFRCCEDFTDRYENVGLSGMNYYNFCKLTDAPPPFYLNTRIYSCILVRTDLYEEFPWRGRYNEDTDLSLRILKAGMCTILFNAFLCGKVTTQRMKGGNTDNVYTDNDHRRKFAESLQEQHPDVVKVVWKFNRWHHQVDYKPFKKNKLIRKEGIEIPDGINNYGMKLITAKGARARDY